MGHRSSQDLLCPSDAAVFSSLRPLADPGGGIRGICPPRQEPGEGIQYKYALLTPSYVTYTSYAYNEELNKNGLESLPSNYFCDQSRFSQRRENFFQTGGAEP